MDLKNMSVNDIRLLLREFKIGNVNAEVTRKINQEGHRNVHNIKVETLDYKIKSHEKQEIYIIGRSTVAIVTNIDDKYGKIETVGISIAHESDKFDHITGIRIACQRAIIKLHEEKLKRCM